MIGWLGVEPRHLTALVAVHREGSFRSAAVSLGLVQSAVSQRIAQLEHLVGMSLVERARGQASLRLTDAGTKLVEHAVDILAEFDAALADLRSLDGESRDTLRIGTYESVASFIVPPALRRLADESPELRVCLHEDTAWQCFFPLVSTGELDAAFADLPLAPGPFAFRELALDPCVLVVRADSPLALRERPPTLPEIGSLPLIAPSWPMLTLIAEHLRAAGVEPKFVFASQINSGVQALVAHGVGAALMPRLAVNERDPRIAIIPLGDALPPRRIALYWHRDRKEISSIMRFLDAVARACGQPTLGEHPVVGELPQVA
jgi:molybdate transport repressor ModE-like protein